LIGASEIGSGTEQVERAARGEGYDFLVRVAHMRGTAGTTVSLSAIHLATGDTEFDRSVLVSDREAQEAVARFALAALQRMAEREDAEIGLRPDALTASPSPRAVRALLDAKRRLMRGDRVGGATTLDSAIAADPDFRLAYFRRAVVEEWLHAWPRLGAAIVERGLARPSPRGMQWIPLLEAQRYFSHSIVDSAVRSFDLLVHDAPRDPDAWLGYAEALYHFGPFLGHRKDEARLPLERAVELGARYPTIISHLADLALARRDTTEVQRYVAYLEQSVDPDPARATTRRLAYMLAFGSGSAKARVWAELDTAVTTRDVFSNLVMQLALELENRGAADSVAGMLMDSRRSPDFKLRGAQYQLALRASMGRWQDGLRAWLSQAEAGAFDEWLVSAHIAGYPADRWAEPMLAEAWAEVRARRSPDFSVAPYADVRTRFRSVVHWTTAYGDSAQARSLLDAIARGLPRPNGADPLPGALEASLHARLALLAGDTTVAVTLLTAAARRPLWHLVAYYPSLSFPAQRMLLAEVHASRGHAARAEDWLDSFREVGAIGDLLYAERVTGLRAELAGQADHDR
jgi:tetratricopeptide (TPR) repeat protein